MKIHNIDHQLEKILEENRIEIKDRYAFYRFWNKVDIKENKEECWNWIGGIGTNGYGNYYYHYKTSPHRVAYILTKGQIADRLQVQHLCNNKRCCNPNHLKLGNPQENTEYMVKCGRTENRKGQNNTRAKFTENDIIYIRKIYDERRKLHPGFKEWQIRDPIAQKFGITKEQVGNIVCRRQWQHVL